MYGSGYFSGITATRIHWGFVCLLLFSSASLAAGPDTEGLVLYLPCENAASPVDASADPTTVAVLGMLTSVDGQLGTRGLGFDGNAANRLEVAHAAKLEGMSALTIEAWALTRGVAGYEGMSLVSKRNAYADADVYNLFIYTSQLVNGRVNGNNTNVGLSTTAIQDNTWYHIALVFNGQGAAGEMIQLYINGVLESSDDHPDAAVGTGGAPVWIGELDAARGFAWDGVLDEIGIWNIALTEEDINLLMAQTKMQLLRKELARTPVPADGAEDVLVTTDLAWTAGTYAVAHDVYFGTSSDDVSDADRAVPMDVLLGQGQASDTYDLDRLDFGQSYYWRIDEVNGAPDRTVFKGHIWSFTTEPLAYPVTNVTAMSNAVPMEGQEPVKVVNGSGLNADDQHSTTTTDMWVCTPNPDEPTYLQFDFDRVYKLYEMLIWNYNMEFESILGLGPKDVTIQYSLDGVEWTALGDFEFARGPGSPQYVYDSVVSFGGAGAKAVRMVINSRWGTMGNQYGLSEVRFLHIPTHATRPVPVDGAAGLPLDTVLSWRPGRDAASHEVYLGTDPNALAVVDTIGQSRYTPALNLDATYYWQILEVNNAEPISSWASDVWSFSTQEYIVVDGFETYNDDFDAGTAMWQTWIDGLEDITNGESMVGNDPSPFAELIIVHSGSQSMPLFYNNESSVVFSETDRTFSPAQDWTGNGIKSLSLWFHGAEGNTGQLYVKINGTKVLYEGDASDISRAAWQPWNIDLPAIGVNLSNITSISIGIEGTGNGVMYIDDIRLYARTPQLFIPAEPGTANLVAYYALDGNGNDSSGNGYNGVENGGPTYVAGHDGQAVGLDGTDDHIIVADVGIAPGEARTISGWAKADTTAVTAWTGVFGFTGPATNSNHFDIQCVGDATATTLGYYGLHRYGWEQDILQIDLEWHHLAATYDGVTVAWFGDGVLLGSQDIPPEDVLPPGPVHIGKRQDNDNYFAGSVDEVRIYNVGLSPGEIAYLAGRTAVVYRPF